MAKEDPAEKQPPVVAEQEAGGDSECPICKMMREGGCEKEFHGFMDCGEAAEKGKADYTECIKLFESMRTCMEKNPSVFAPMLKMDDEDPKEKGQEGGFDERGSSQ